MSFFVVISFNIPFHLAVRRTNMRQNLLATAFDRNANRISLTFFHSL